MKIIETEMFLSSRITWDGQRRPISNCSTWEKAVKVANTLTHIAQGHINRHEITGPTGDLLGSTNPDHTAGDCRGCKNPLQLCVLCETEPANGYTSDMISATCQPCRMEIAQGY